MSNRLVKTIPTRTGVRVLALVGLVGVGARFEFMRLDEEFYFEQFVSPTTGVVGTYQLKQEKADAKEYRPVTVVKGRDI